MSDSEKPKSWKERRQSIKHKWLVPVFWVEWFFEFLRYFLDHSAVFNVLGRAPRLAALVSMVIGASFYMVEADKRGMQAENQRKATHYQAWQVIKAAQGQQSSGGRVEALQDLNKDKVSLAGIDISKAYLIDLNLENANLAEAILTDANLPGADLSNANLTNASLSWADLVGANLSNANLTKARLRGTDLTGVDLTGANLAGVDFSYVNLTEAILMGADLVRTNLWNANLAGADLTDANLAKIKGWQTIKNIKNANIYGVKNPPDGFEEWAIEQGAVSIEDDEE